MKLSKTVLIVEDNEENRDMLARRLARRGWNPIVAIDGRQGVELALSEHPDIVLMDMSLPVMDGWEATRILKSHAGAKGIPVIALTAHAMSGDRENALAAGCDEFETKPVEFAVLLEKMRRLAGIGEEG